MQLEGLRQSERRWCRIAEYIAWYNTHPAHSRLADRTPDAPYFATCRHSRRLHRMSHVLRPECPANRATRCKRRPPPWTTLQRAQAARSLPNERGKLCSPSLHQHLSGVNAHFAARWCAATSSAAAFSAAVFALSNAVSAPAAAPSAPSAFATPWPRL